MGKIQLLSNALVNKIAAGEVIERPASVVKELLENALDAGATHVRIDVEDGGRRLIRVTDNGCGMSPDDLSMCLQSHATSKIHHEDDLFSIATMGFRGEALPSIGAVSHVRVVSRPAEQDAAHEIEMSGSRVGDVRVAAAPPGTGVEVRNLFFNVPARQKFLRGPNTEIGHIVDQLARIALAHPTIGMELTHNGRTMHRLEPTESISRRIADFYGRELADSLLSISGGRSDLGISGSIALPARARSAAKWQFSFVNGRYVRDRYIQHAVKEAYRGLIEPTRFPVVFLFLRIAPSALDVNVHPTKIEVRWQDSNLVHSTVLAALRETLLRHDLTPTLESAPAVDDSARVRSEQVRQAIADFFKRNEPTQRSLDFSPREPVRVRLQVDGAPAEAVGRSEPEPAPGAGEVTPKSEPAAVPGPVVRPHAIQIHNTYLVAETSDGVVIIDQHALHERILYQQLSDRITRGNLETQRLLLPEPVQVTPQQTALLEEQAELLHRLGLEVAPFGPNAAAIQSCPSLLNDADTPAFLADLLDKLAEKGQREHAESLLQEVLEMMACKAAVKAGDPLTPEEIESLIAQRERVDKSSSCPHGRPTTLRLTVSDLERQFKRT